MHSQPGFSFIIPAFNAAQTLERCISHIRSQQYPTHLIECIVVDNGSQDSTPQLAKALADHWYQDTEATIAGLRNFGASKARNEILVFVDADCLIPSDYAAVAATLFEDRMVGMAGSKTHELPDTAGWVSKTWKVHLDRSQVSTEARWLVTRSLAVRTRAFREIGGFDQEIETCEDVSFGHSIGAHWKIVSDERLTPLHLEDADSLNEFLRKEIWRAQNSSQISWKWIKQNPLLLLSNEGLSFILPFYFLGATVLVILGLLSLIATGSAIALLFAVLAFATPVVMLSWDTTRRAGRNDRFRHLVVLYTLYILAKVIALFYHGNRSTPRRVV